MTAVKRDERGERERGVALLAALVALVVLSAAASDLAFNTHVDFASAVNARDDLRAHYLSRSGVNLARLLLRVQARVIEPNRKLLGGMDLQIADYAPMLMSFFNSKEGAEALGSLLGVESGGIKGIGVDVGSFDLEMTSLDGKLNVNCAGGSNPGAPNVVRTAAALAAMFLPERYNSMFETEHADGQFYRRVDVLRAIIDWADQDQVMFGSGNAEDYRYNSGPDPYEIKNHYFDTLEELRLVKGVNDVFMAAFGDSLTVYGDCKVNVNLAPLPLLTGLILQYAATPNDPALRWDNLALLVRVVGYLRDTMGGFTDLKTFISAIEDPATAAAPAFAMGALGGNLDGDDQEPVLPPGLTMPNGVKLRQGDLKDAIVVGGERRIWRLTASSEVGRVKKKISAVWDVKYVSFQAQRHNMGPGGFLYWREE